tara:strand:+ start:844 stop:1152 length:309 start_codon:yes stop_codon:yes gene_type:complete
MKISEREEIEICNVRDDRREEMMRTGCTVVYQFKKYRPSLEEAQTMVGGYIEEVSTPFKEIQLYVDEEGLLKGSPVNMEASMLAMKTIVGDAVMLRGKAKWT